MIQVNNLLDKKLFNYQKKLSDIEKKYFFSLLPSIDLDKFNLIKKKISNHKLIINILYNSPEFYLDLKEIQLDFTREPNELSFLEIIWINEHYEFIDEIKSTQNDIIQLIKFSNKYNLISFIQYKFIKKLLPKINKIFEYDKSMEYFYLPEKNIIFYITIEEIELFYNIIDIIIAKIDIISSLLFKKYDISNLTTNTHYSNLIKKIKLKLEKI